VHIDISLIHTWAPIEYRQAIDKMVGCANECLGDCRRPAGMGRDGPRPSFSVSLRPTLAASLLSVHLAPAYACRLACHLSIL
jgi:hypothetical protein